MSGNSNPKMLAPGAYWYMVPGKEPTICEKREGEAFVRFTNGGRQDWLRDGESFYGPLPLPEVVSAGGPTEAARPKHSPLPQHAVCGRCGAVHAPGQNTLCPL